MTTTQFSAKHFLVDTAVSNGAMTAVLLGSAKLNPEIWAHDYPPDIKEAFGPISPEAKRQAKLIAIPFFGLMIGSIIASNLRLKKRNGGSLPLKAAFLNAYGLLLSFWLLDLTIFDWLIFVRLTPDFVVLPGTEGMAGYNDYGFHLREHLKALPMLAVFALMLALLTKSWR